MSLAPVALFAFNRPDHLAKTLVSLAANTFAADSDLIIFCDGSRSPSDEAQVALVRQVARSANGFRTLQVIERERNIGLVASITGEVKQLCRDFGRVIVLEDDLITAPLFLSFMNDALARYEHEPRVMQISGYMYPVAPSAGNQVVFLPVTSCWGWATWRRAWDSYDSSMTGFEELKADTVRRRAFNLDGHYDYIKLLSEHMTGKVNSWGVVWHLSVFMNHGLTIYPPSSLVSNMGFDGSGTHGQSSGFGRVELNRAIESVTWPDQIEIDQDIYLDVKKIIRTSKKGLGHWLRNLFPA